MAPAKAAPSPAAPSGPAKKLSFKDQHDLDRLPGEIAKIEAEISTAEAKLGDPGLYARNPEEFDRLTAAIEALRGKLDAAETRWMEVAEKAEALSG